MITKKMAIDITADLDKRPIAKLVQEASRFSSSVFFEYRDKKVNAKSIMGMMTFISIMNNDFYKFRNLEGFLFLLLCAIMIFGRLCRLKE